MDQSLALFNTLVMLGAIVGPFLALALIALAGDRLPITGPFPVIVVVQWALGLSLGLYIWASALRLVPPLGVEAGQQLPDLLLWLMGWGCVATSSVLALGYWRRWRRLPEAPTPDLPGMPRDLTRRGRGRP